jgi:hypothetical protein
MVALNLPLAHAVQQTEIIQLGGFGFTLRLVATDATVVVQPEAWLLVPVEVLGEIVQDLLRLHLLCPEVNTTSFVRVSAYDDSVGRADMLEPFEHQGATGQEEFLGFTHGLAGTTKKHGHIVEWAQRGGARDPV